MSKTGRYKVIDGEVVKVSDKAYVPGHVWFPKDSIHTGGHFENLNDQTFATRAKKREYMKRHNIAEAG